MAASNSEYMDILLLGKTGSGKSTTADRLLVANSQPLADFDMTAHEKEGGNTQLQDILIWRLSGRSVEDVKEQVKYFLSNRAIGVDPLNSVDPNCKSPDSVTKDCVLLSNEKTRVRVLDVPGFHTSSPSEVMTVDNQTANQDNLGIMRQILRIQSIKQLHFRRILYFLPVRGPLEKADANIQQELRIMHHYFGSCIFDSMVMVATFHSRRSSVNAFTSEDEEDTRLVLNRIFQHVLSAPDQNSDDFPAADIPQPPIFYISLRESNTEMFRRLQETHVKTVDGLELRLDENTCARCSLKFGVYRIGNGATPLVAIDDGQRSAYDQSKCHPLIKPKHSRVIKFLGGIAYIATLGIPALVADNPPWPGFFNHDEECPHCKGPPGSPGCLKVGSEWKIKDKVNKVNHKSDLDELQIVVED